MCLYAVIEGGDIAWLGPIVMSFFGLITGGAMLSAWEWKKLHYEVDRTNYFLISFNDSNLNDPNEVVIARMLLKKKKVRLPSAKSCPEKFKNVSFLMVNRRVDYLDSRVTTSPPFQTNHNDLLIQSSH